MVLIFNQQIAFPIQPAVAAVLLLCSRHNTTGTRGGSMLLIDDAPKVNCLFTLPIQTFLVVCHLNFALVILSGLREMDCRFQHDVEQAGVYFYL